ncbi:MAG: sigma-70 family RNA polymerase sigma factor [Bacteroidota bacterium]
MSKEKNIVEQCKTGDERAFKVLYNSYAPYVYTIVKDYILEHEERRDMLQDIFAHIFLSIKQYDEAKGQFKPWVRRLTINRCAVHLRSKNRLQLVFSMKDVKEDTEDLAFLDTMQRDELEHILKPMPQGYRTIFLLNVLDDYSHKEIAKLLNIKEQTSRSQLARAIKWIKSNKHVKSRLSKTIRNGK